ncbi:thiamine biosynthesis protein-like protein [Candidatus Magnetomorum sp. HK-1]|nr:thiamine biosynthesis protein-like protein [Candidatus Magnetomorum sp. HK-1]
MNDLSISKPITAMGLCSGGLDSILAGMLLIKQGIQVKWICFETPFFNAEKAKIASEQTGIPLLTHNLTQDYIKMLKNPRQGYGKNMNPCLDCHTLMFNTAGNLMKENDAHFLFSGEILGQRPMSQTRPSLNYVEKNSGYKGYILRPLCALNMQESIPEKNGWVDRSKLLNITGRSRKRQIALAEEWGISDYPNPAGGCLLTDQQYSIRLKDVFENGPYLHDRDLYLLQWGRHFRLNQTHKIIVGRTQKDNENIIKYYQKECDILLDILDYPSPIVLIPYGSDPHTIEQAASIAVSYTRAPEKEPTSVECLTPAGVHHIQVYPIPKSKSCHWRI